MVDKRAEEPLDHLRRQRNAVLDKLRKLEPDLVGQLESWDKAIESVKLGMATRYARHLSGADALVEYLQENGPSKRLEAIKAVAAGGWGSTRSDPIGVLHDAIDYQLERAQNAKIVSLGSDIIGTPEQKKSRKK